MTFLIVNRLSTMKQALIISKANQLARSSSTLDLMETRVIEYCLSNLHFTENITSDDTFKVDIDAMSKHFDMNRSNAYRDLKKVALSLMTKVVHIPYFWHPNNNVATQWVSGVVYNDTNEVLELNFSKFIIPYISGAAIKREFTTYSLTDVSKFRKLYSIKLYNLCKSHAFKCSFQISLVELRDFLAIEDTKYPNWGDLKIVLNRTIKEINEKSSLAVEMVEAGKTRGKVSLLEFRINSITGEKDEH